MGEHVTIAKFPSTVEAELARAQLGAKGIEAIVVESAGFNPILNTTLGVAVEVPEADAKSARAILDELAKVPDDDGSEDEEPGEDVVRCPSCELEWDESRVVRRAAQRIFVPPISVLCGGVTFGILLPLMAILPGIAGALVVAIAATAMGTTSALGTHHLIQGAARAQFLREKSRQLPVARLLRGHHHHHPRALPPGR